MINNNENTLREAITLEQLMEDAGIACHSESVLENDEPVIQKEHVL